MQRYVALRVFQGLVSVGVVVSLVFFMTRVSGDVLYLLLPIDATPQARAELSAVLGLDRPLLVQYGRYMWGLLHGDFGKSVVIMSGTPVMGLIFQRFPATLQLGGVAMLFTLLVSVPLGVYAAVARGSLWDWSIRAFAVLGQSMPVFWLGILLMYVFSVRLDLLPPGGRGGLQNLILPSFTIGWFAMAGIARLTRSSMLEVLGSEYVKLARAKGMPEFIVIWKHALRNALLPVVTFTAIVFVGLFLMGSIIVEVVFAWPGVAQLLFEATMARDYPVVQGGVIVLTALYVLANLAVDVLYAYLDPRIRVGQR